jgi:hypothetical protein
VPPPEIIDFTYDDLDRIVAVMGELAEAKRGWVNIRPNVDPDTVPPQGRLRVFSVQGPHVPVATWALPEEKQRPQYISIGLQHPAAERAKQVLARTSLLVDPRWRVLADHPRRGIVIAVPMDEDRSTVLNWLLRAAQIMCRLPFDGWKASVYRR